jgi:hypothetical protein
MKVSLYRLFENQWEKNPNSYVIADHSPNLILCFGSKEILNTEDIYDLVKSKFSNADIVFCSTAGEIYQDEVLDNSLVLAALQFEKTKHTTASVNSKDFPNTFAAAIALAKKLQKKDLKYVLLLSDGSLVNGSELTKGVSSQFDKNILITGGLAGDGYNFVSTLTGLNAPPKEGEIIAIGFYGDNIKITHGSQSGWDIFGLEKRVTNSSANILVELENQNAFDLYKKYLGPEAEKLPGAALLYPLSVIIPGTEKPVVRTILSINEEEKTMRFAGDIPVGSRVRFMKSNFERLTMAASEASEITTREGTVPDFSLLISCVGRKLVLGDKTAEEVKAVSQTFNNKTVLAGFYSYGEISPFNEGGNCQLHNQTMTITSFYEN